MRLLKYSLFDLGNALRVGLSRIALLGLLVAIYAVIAFLVAPWVGALRQRSAGADLFLHSRGCRCSIRCCVGWKEWSIVIFFARTTIRRRSKRKSVCYLRSLDSAACIGPGLYRSGHGAAWNCQCGDRLSSQRSRRVYDRGQRVDGTGRIDTISAETVSLGEILACRRLSGRGPRRSDDPSALSGKPGARARNFSALECRVADAAGLRTASPWRGGVRRETIAARI